MRHSLHSHVIYLEGKVQSLKDQLTRRHLTAQEVQDLEQQVYYAELALLHYRQAYKLELSLSDPPEASDPGSERGTGAPEGSRPDKKKKGLAAATIRARRSSFQRPSRPVRSPYCVICFWAGSHNRRFSPPLGLWSQLRVAQALGNERHSHRRSN